MANFVIYNQILGGDMEKTVVAICYDFDKTLSVDDMQAFSFIPNLGMTAGEFWNKCDTFLKENHMDGILSFLRMMLETCKEKNIKLTREYLYSLGKDIKYYDGVITWFDRMNEYAHKLGIELEHYVISSGNKEIIEGSVIYDKFKEVYASEFLYDENGEACWPKIAINHTQKTQYIFRIQKGMFDLVDGGDVNERVQKRHVECRNMIYIGDGMTDVPCMAIVKERGGTAISIYQPDNKKNSIKLIEEDRVNYACSSDFSPNSKLEHLMKLILRSISLKERLIAGESKNETL